MTTYHFRAIDETGQMIEDSLDTASIDALNSVLEGRGLLPVTVRAGDRQARAAGTLGSRGTRLSGRDLAILSRQMGVLLHSGVTVSEALHSLAAQATPQQRPLFLAVGRSVQQGEKLSSAFEHHPRSFPRLFVATVAAAEAVGALSTAFRQLATMLEWEMRLKRDVRGALQYPATVVVVMAVAVLVLQQIVVPQFSSVFKQLGGTLPLPTRILIGCSTFVGNWWWALIAGAALLVWAARRYHATPRGRRRGDAFVLRIPLVGNLLERTYLARFARTFSLLQRNGLPLLSTLDLIEQTAGNSVIAAEVGRLREAVTRGSSLSDAVAGSRVFTPMVKNMIRVGERSGQLDETLEGVSDYYEEETRAAVRDLTQWIEPLLVLVLGGFVLFLALAIFLPWWDMASVYRHG